MRELARRCVAAADEVWRLQNDADRESRFFQRMVGQKRPGGSRQGIYLATPEGVLLARINSRDPRKVERTLRDGLAKWEALGADRTAPVDDEGEFPKHERWEAGYPEDGLVLRLVKRDLVEGDDGTTTVGSIWNMDHAWFDRNEAASLLPAHVRVGMRVMVPQTLAMRLARFHLVDNVRGQTLPFAESEIETLSLWLEIVEVGDGRIRARLEGRVASRASEWIMGESDWKPRRSWPRGLEADLVGDVEFDSGSSRVTAFDAVVLATRRGRTRFNARRDPGESRIAAVISLASSDEPRVAPAFIDVYDAEWSKGRRVAPPRR